jgi:starvation-inducible DNA-binding protein
MILILLIDQLALSTTMRNCRWNVTGPQELQQLFVSHDRLVGETMGDIASRAQAAGEGRTAILARYLSQARAKAHPGEHPRASEITSVLQVGHQTVIGRLRDRLGRCADMSGDMITMDFLNGLIERHEKMAAELRALAAKPNQRSAP